MKTLFKCCGCRLIRTNILIVFSSVLWIWIWILLFRSFRILLFKQGQLSNWQILMDCCKTFLQPFLSFLRKYVPGLCTAIIVNDELDCFEENFAKIIQIFLYKIRWNYSGSNRSISAALLFLDKLDKKKRRVSGGQNHLFLKR